MRGKSIARLGVEAVLRFDRQVSRNAARRTRSERARRVHIVGCYRSGTTLMMELMWLGYPFSGRAEHEASLLAPPPPGETLYLTKKPPDTVRIERAFRSDDETFLIAMLRDPRSVVTSRHGNRPDLYFRGFRHWRDCARAIDRLRTHPRCLVVRFEDLVTEPDAVQQAIEGRFGFLERRAHFSDYPAGVRPADAALRSLGGIRRLDPSRIAGWKDHLPRVKAQLAAHPDLATSLVKFGYEPDDAWSSALVDVRPHAQGHKEKAPHLFKRWETALRYRRRTRAYLCRRGLLARGFASSGR